MKTSARVGDKLKHIGHCEPEFEMRNPITVNSAESYSCKGFFGPSEHP